jgi:hypothetical protein
MTAAPTAQLPFQIDEPRVVLLAAGYKGVADDRAMPANRARRLDNMPLS